MAIPFQWKHYRGVIVAVVSIVVLTGGIELLMRRSPLGPDGKFGLWEGNIWSAECSQRLADPCSFSHIGHGILFFGLFWAIAPNSPIRYRFLAAVLLEGGWELLENSPIIINRYRLTTIALGYAGDSVLNSLSDLMMMSLGFLLALRVRPWISVAVLLAMEVGCGLWIRDNLTLNHHHADPPDSGDQSLANGDTAGFVKWCGTAEYAVAESKIIKQSIGRITTP